MKATGKLTAKQERFVQEYMKDLNASAAAARAGYSKKTAPFIGCENLKKPNIAAAIQAGKAEKAAAVGLTAERVLKEMQRIAFFDIRKIFNADGSLKRIVDLDDDTAAGLAGVEAVEIGGDGQLAVSKKFKVSDKKGALEMLGRHLSLFNDKIKVIDDRERMTDDELREQVAEMYRKHGINGPVPGLPH